MRGSRMALATGIALLLFIMASAVAHGVAQVAPASPAQAMADDGGLRSKPAVPEGYTHRPIIELFTGLWCPPCMDNMHPALDRYYSNDWEPEAPDHPCHIIEFHVRWGRTDELATSESEEWARRRGITGVPSYWADMVELEVGAGDPTSAYYRLKEHLNSVGDDEVDPVVLLVEQRRDGRLFNVTVRMRYVGLKDELPVVLYVFMAEDEVRAWSTYLEEYTTCRYVFRGFAIKGLSLSLPRGEWVEKWALWSAQNAKDPTKVHAVAVLYRQGGRAIASACDVCSAHDMADEQAPEIDGPYRSPDEVWPGQSVCISARVADDTGVLAVFLAYRVGGGDWQELPMSYNGSAYVATIGPFEAGDVVTYRVMAYDIPGNLACAEDGFTVGGGAEDTEPPVIDAIWTEPAQPGPNEPFYVYVVARDDGSGVASVVVCLSVNGQDVSCVMAEQVNATTWRAEMPGQPAGSSLVIHITVSDNAGNTAEDTLTLTVKSSAGGGAGGGGGGPGMAIDTGILMAVAIPVAAAAVVGALIKLRR